MIFYLHPTLHQYFNREASLFDQLMMLKGERYRNQDGRITQKVFIGHQPYFIKQHFGVGYREIFKNLLQGRMPIVSAKNEWRALQQCKAANIATAEVVGFGERGLNPAKRQSFVLMEALLPSLSLEEICVHWHTLKPPFLRKIKYLTQVATIARQLHALGMNHRDFYLCHFLLGGRTSDEALYLIDLHRTSLRAGKKERWALKDLSGLYFSSHNIGLTQRDYYRFMKIYRHKSLREILSREEDFWYRVKIRGDNLYHAHAQS